MGYSPYINFKILYQFTFKVYKYIKYTYKAISYNSNFFKKEYSYLKIKRLYFESKYLNALECAAATFADILNLVRYIANLAHF